MRGTVCAGVSVLVCPCRVADNPLLQDLMDGDGRRAGQGGQCVHAAELQG